MVGDVPTRGMFRQCSDRLTSELFPAHGGTRLVYTEQGQYFDGGDQALQREIGCGELYDALGEELASAHCTRPWAVVRQKKIGSCDERYS
jgi:hypothetical protein